MQHQWYWKTRKASANMSARGWALPGVVAQSEWRSTTNSFVFGVQGGPPGWRSSCRVCRLPTPAPAANILAPGCESVSLYACDTARTQKHAGFLVLRSNRLKPTGKTTQRVTKLSNRQDRLWFPRLPLFPAQHCGHQWRRGSWDLCTYVRFTHSLGGKQKTETAPPKWDRPLNNASSIKKSLVGLENTKMQCNRRWRKKVQICQWKVVPTGSTQASRQTVRKTCTKKGPGSCKRMSKAPHPQDSQGCKPSFLLAIRKYLDFLDSGTKDWRIVNFTSSPTHFICSSVWQPCAAVTEVTCFNFLASIVQLTEFFHQYLY